MMLKRQINANVFGLTIGAVINFLGVMTFLSLSLAGFEGKEALLTQLLVAFSFLQVLEALRLPVVYEISQLPSRPCSTIASVCLCGGALSILLSVFVSVCIIFLEYMHIINLTWTLLLATFLYSINGVAWGVANAKNTVHFAAVAKAISNALGFLSLYVFSRTSPGAAHFSLVISPMIFSFFLIMILFFRSRKSRANLSPFLFFNRPSFDGEILRSLATRSIGVFLNNFLSTTQGNIERLCATFFGGGQLLLLISYFSELGGRLSFFPRILYSAIYPLLVGRDTLDSRKFRILGFLVITAVIVAAFGFLFYTSKWVIATIFPQFSESAGVYEIFMYFTLTSFLKLYSYWAALILNVKGDFNSQPVFILATISLGALLLLNLKDDGNVIMWIFVASIVARSSDILVALYASTIKISGK